MKIKIHKLPRAIFTSDRKVIFTKIICTYK